MKKLFFLPLAFLALKAFAQEPYYDFKKFREDRYGHQIMPMEKDLSIDSLKNLIERIEKAHQMRTLGRLVYTQPNGTKFYSLPNDNMPCIVPDLSQYNYNMPNAAESKKITGMPPDPGFHERIFPKQ